MEQRRFFYLFLLFGILIGAANGACLQGEVLCAPNEGKEESLACVLMDESFQKTYDSAYLRFVEADYKACDELLAGLRRDMQEYMSGTSLSSLDSTFLNLYVSVLTLSGQVKLYLQDYVAASGFFTEIMHSYVKDTLSLAAAKAYNGMGTVLGYMKKQEDALAYMFKALHIAREKGNLRYESMAASNVMGIYSQLGEADLALKYALESYEAALKIKDQDVERYVNALFNLALAYHGVGNVSAGAYYEKALSLAEEKKLDHLALYIRYNYVLLLHEGGSLDKARAFGEKNVKEAKKLQNRSMEKAQWDELAQIYEEAGSVYKEIEALKRSMALSEEIHYLESSEKLSFLQHEFDSYKEIQQQISERQRMEIVAQKLKIRNLWLIVISVLSLALAGVVLFLVRMIVRQCRVNNLMKQRLNQSMLNLEGSLAYQRDDYEKKMSLRDREAAATALYLVRIGNIVSAVMPKIKALRLMGSSAKEKLLLTEVENLLKQVEPEKRWGEFETYFLRVDRSFFARLSQLYPDLTPNEKRLLALISLNLSSKEISVLTNRSFDSINTAKSRLKKKLALDEETSLDSFVSSLL